MPNVVDSSDPFIYDTPVRNGYFQGYISNFRVTTGQALYTGNFTPPTGSLTTSSAGATSQMVFEEQRTNLFTYSADFNDASWLKTRSGVTPNTVIAPDGTLTGDYFYANGTGVPYLYKQITLTQYQPYTMSCFVKQGDLPTPLVRLRDFTEAGSVVFDIVSGTISTSESGICSNPSIVNAGNGWFRISAVFTPTIATGNHNISPVHIDDVAGTIFGFYCWGAQLEAGAYPTSYIATTNTPVTRFPGKFVSNVAQLNPTSVVVLAFVDSGPITKNSSSVGNISLSANGNPTIQTIKTGLTYDYQIPRPTEASSSFKTLEYLDKFSVGDVIKITNPNVGFSGTSTVTAVDSDTVTFNSMPNFPTGYTGGMYIQNLSTYVYPQAQVKVSNWRDAASPRERLYVTRFKENKTTVKLDLTNFFSDVGNLPTRTLANLAYYSEPFLTGDFRSPVTSIVSNSTILGDAVGFYQDDLDLLTTANANIAANVVVLSFAPESQSIKFPAGANVRIVNTTTGVKTNVLVVSSTLSSITVNDYVVEDGANLSIEKDGAAVYSKGFVAQPVFGTPADSRQLLWYQTYFPQLTKPRTGFIVSEPHNRLIANINVFLSGATNLLLYSAQFGAPWGWGFSTVTSDVTLSPDGGINGDKIDETAVTQEHYVRQIVTGLTTNTTYTVSIFVKAAERTRLRIRALDLDIVQNGYEAFYNLTTGTVINAYGGGAGSLTGTSITPVGNGWYRCAVSGNTGTGTKYIVDYFIGDDSGSFFYPGVTGSGLFLWGAQLEAGSTVTDYIPTFGSPGTRAVIGVANITNTKLGNVGLTPLESLYFSVLAPGLKKKNYIENRLYSLGDISSRQLSTTLVENDLDFYGRRGQAVYTVPGTYQWIAPVGVTTVSVVAVGGGGGGSNYSDGGGGGGLGWATVPVVPGQIYTVTVGAGGRGGESSTAQSLGFNGGDSWFISNTTVAGFGGRGGGRVSGNPGGGYIGTGGGWGGRGGTWTGLGNRAGAGGGGAAGFTGNGGRGGDSHTLSTVPTQNTSGTGGGAGGGSGAYAIIPRGYSYEYAGSSGTGGGGVGIFQSGTDGLISTTITLDYNEGLNADAYVANWNPTTTFAMTSFGDLGAAVAHGYSPSTTFTFSLSGLGTHTQVRYRFNWHFVDSVDGETSTLDIDGVRYLQFTKSALVAGASSITTNLCQSFTWVTSNNYSYAPWQNNNPAYFNGYFIVDTGWINHTNSNISIAHFFGPEQVQTDEASYLTNVSLQARIVGVDGAGGSGGSSGAAGDFFTENFRPKNGLAGGSFGGGGSGAGILNPVANYFTSGGAGAGGAVRIVYGSGVSYPFRSNLAVTTGNTLIAQANYVSTGTSILNSKDLLYYSVLAKGYRGQTSVTFGRILADDGAVYRTIKDGIGSFVSNLLAVSSSFISTSQGGVSSVLDIGFSRGQINIAKWQAAGDDRLISPSGSQFASFRILTLIKEAQAEIKFGTIRKDLEKLKDLQTNYSLTYVNGKIEVFRLGTKGASTFSDVTERKKEPISFWS